MIADNPGSLGKLSQMVNFVPFVVGQLYLSADGSSWLSLSLPWDPSMKEFSSLFKLDPAPALCLTLGAETLSGRSKLGIRHRQAHNSLTTPPTKKEKKEKPKRKQEKKEKEKQAHNSLTVTHQK